MHNMTLSDNKNTDFVSAVNGIPSQLGNTHISFSPSVIAGNALVFSPTEYVQFSFLSNALAQRHLS